MVALGSALAIISCQALVTVATGTCVYDSYWAMRSVVLHPLPLCAHYQLAEMPRANNGSLG